MSSFRTFDEHKSKFEEAVRKMEKEMIILIEVLTKYYSLTRWVNSLILEEQEYRG